MTREEIDVLMRARFKDVQSADDRWQVVDETQQLFLVMDSETDRVRIMTPVAAVDRADAATFRRLLEANFLSSLDVRYAIFDDVLWSIFVAPLSVMGAAHLDNVISQVLELSRTTGTSFSATPVGMTTAFLQLH